MVNNELAKAIQSESATAVDFGGAARRKLCGNGARHSVCAAWDRKDHVVFCVLSNKLPLLLLHFGNRPPLHLRFSRPASRSSSFMTNAVRLDAPIERIATPDVPIPYNVDLMNAVLPSVEHIAERMRALVAF